MDGHVQLGPLPPTTASPTTHRHPNHRHAVQVTVVDISEKQIGAWNSDDLPIFEPGLLEVQVLRGYACFPGLSASPAAWMQVAGLAIRRAMSSSY